jgi:transposase
MGRSRGGLSTKIHAVVDARGLPIDLALTPGHTHDMPPALALIKKLRKGSVLLADRAYDSNAIRDFARARGAFANIPSKVNRKVALPFDKKAYRARNLVERFFNKLKQFRGIATRYDKNPENFLAAVKLACIRIWLRYYESTP